MTTWTMITGASEGLGREFARLAAKDNHNIILTARSQDKLNALADDLRSPDREVVVLTADLSRAGEPERLWAEATQGRQIDVLVNNAGLGSHADFADGQAWTREMDSMQVNMIALTYLMKQATAHMLSHGKGRILNVASVAGFMPGPNMAVYSATKAYVLSLSTAAAEELRGTGVTVTALCPGATATSFFDAADMNDARFIKMRAPARADQVAELGWLQARIGKGIVVPGGSNKATTWMARILPRGVLARLANTAMSKR